MTGQHPANDGRLRDKTRRRGESRASGEEREERGGDRGVTERICAWVCVVWAASPLCGTGDMCGRGAAPWVSVGTGMGPSTAPLAWHGMSSNRGHSGRSPGRLVVALDSMRSIACRRGQKGAVTCWPNGMMPASSSGVRGIQLRREPQSTPESRRRVRPISPPSRQPSKNPNPKSRSPPHDRPSLPALVTYPRTQSPPPQLRRIPAKTKKTAS